MEFRSKNQSGITIASIEGYIDTSEIADFSSALLHLIQEGGNKILLDLSGIDYLGSAGLRALMVTHQEAIKKGEIFVLCSPKNEILDLIKVVHFEQFFTLYATKDEALQALADKV